MNIPGSRWRSYRLLSAAACIRGDGRRVSSNDSYEIFGVYWWYCASFVYIIW